MRVLMWMSSAGGTVPGGHRIQMEKTADALREAGAAVRVVVSDVLSAESVDVVHGFGLTGSHIAAAKARGLLVAVSPIYVDRRYYRQAMRAYSRTLYARAVVRQTASFVAGACRVRRRWYAETRRAYELADLLLPNSAGEARALRHDLHVRTRILVTPNGVDEATFSLPKDNPPRDHVIYVGRIEPHKNQLGLIEAMRDSGLPLLLIGSAHPHHQGYADRCHDAARGQPVTFQPAIAHVDLPALYHRARVHAMPSFFETTGLASLEAAACGCSIVSTREGWAREYFGDLATYCRPVSRRSIRQAVDRAWTEATPPALRRRVLDRYTWRHTAAATLEAYESLLLTRRPRPT